MKAITLVILFFSCYQNSPEQHFVLDLASQTSISEKQQIIDRFYQQSPGKLTIYYSFGSLIMQHQPNSDSLIVRYEEELNEEVVDIVDLICPLSAVSNIDWVSDDIDTVRDRPPTSSQLIDHGCSEQSYKG